MQLEVGGIYEGKVTGITKFGAFVELAPGRTGMVHISEVASTYVKEIRDFVKEGQTVKVKVLNIGEDGKISLSMKRAEPAQEGSARGREGRREDPFRHEARQSRPPRAPRPVQSGPARPGDFEWQSRPLTGGSFEDMMSRFKQTSDEKISDLKKNTETKRGSFSTRRENR